MNPEIRPVVLQLELQAANFKTLSVILKRFINDQPFPTPGTQEDEERLLDSMYFLSGLSELVEHYHNESIALVQSYYHCA